MDDEVADILGNNRIEDVRWLCSLTDSELDLLISLKCLAIQRAKRIGHIQLAEKFNLKVLRGLSFVMMENLKRQLNELPSTSASSEGSTYLSGCNLLRCNPDEKFANMGIDELKEYVYNARKKRIAKVFKDMTPKKKQKCDGG
ncbi:hypothetical protein Leryth_009622 [Lithospermum erythrorhizon]|nr:hypothetical protein Leryth_009622 [Lithospermum erythrorhizon]